MTARRSALTGLFILALFAAPLALEAQQARVYRVGVVHQGGAYSKAVDRLRDGLTSLFAEAGFKSARVTTHERAARFPSIEAFLHTEIDGWVLRGRVDVGAMLAVGRRRLESLCTSSGAVNIPMEGHIVLSSA